VRTHLTDHGIDHRRRKAALVLKAPAILIVSVIGVWQKKSAPLWCTASTMGFHASTCSCVQMPGVSG
jgi:hypothetical protein